MAKALKTTKSQAAPKSKSAASKALVPASKAATATAIAPVLSKKEASAAARRLKEKTKRTLARLEREMDSREQRDYFTLKTRMHKKAAAYIGHSVRDYGGKDGMRLEIAALGKELSQFGERLVIAAISKKGYSVEDEYLAEAFKDGGLLERLDKLRVEVFCNRNLRIAFSSYHEEPQGWSRE